MQLVQIRHCAFFWAICFLYSTISPTGKVSQAFEVHGDNDNRVMELGIGRRLRGHPAPTSHPWQGWQTSWSHIQWKGFHTFQIQLLADGRLELLESSSFWGAQTCFIVVEFFRHLSNPTNETQCKSSNLTISFLAFITFTGPDKWFRFQNWNPWPSLNLPNIFCQEASWTFDGKVNQTGVCFPPAKAQCLLRPAGLISSVGGGWLPRTSRGVCLW